MVVERCHILNENMTRFFFIKNQREGYLIFNVRDFQKVQLRDLKATLMKMDK